MGRPVALFAACLILLPVAAEAQIEVGLDAGLTLSAVSGRDNLTRFSVPASALRLGGSGDGMRFETLFGLTVLSSDGTVTILNVIPGLNFPMGEGGAYVRPEAGLNLISGGGNTESEFLAGVAAGLRKSVDDGPVFFRLEVGFDRWFDTEVNQFRALAGLSVVVGG